MNLPCKDCICLAICRSQAASTYREIMLSKLELQCDSYTVMIIIEKDLIIPLTNKCDSISSYISKRKYELYVDGITKVKLLEMINYLNSPLHDIYNEADEHTEQLYQNYLATKNKKINKDLRYG